VLGRRQRVQRVEPRELRPVRAADVVELPAVLVRRAPQDEVLLIRRNDAIGMLMTIEMTFFSKKRGK